MLRDYARGLFATCRCWLGLLAWLACLALVVVVRGCR